MTKTELNIHQPQMINKDDTLRQFLFNFLSLLFILLGASLASVQMREQILLDNPTTELFFDRAVPSGSGWQEPEISGSWMADTRAILTLPFNKDLSVLTFRATGITPDVTNSLRVSVNGFDLDLTYETDSVDWREYQGTLPDTLIESSPDELEFAFTVDHVVSPVALGLNDDARELGAKLDWLRIDRSARVVTESAGLYLAVTIGAAITAIGLITTQTSINVLDSKRRRFAAAAVAAGIAIGLIIVFVEGITIIQLFYFGLIAIVIAALTILWTPELSSQSTRITTFDHLKKLLENRTLLYMWVQYNIRSRYSQAFLGIMWIIVQPLTTAIIFSFVFSQIFHRFSTGDAPFISFYLAAIIAWNVFSHGLLNGAISLTNSSGLLTQVYFPREILILVRLGEVLVDTFFTFMAMIILNALFGIFPNVNYLFLPLLLIIQLSFVMGLMFFTSYLSVMIRDIPQLIGIIIQFLFYLTPILYPLEAIPERYMFIALLNPLAPLVDAYRNVILFNTAPDLTTLYYPIVTGGVLFYTGYVFFKKNEKRVIDYL